MLSVFSLYYFPPTAWFSLLKQLEVERVALEVSAFYEKQQYYNRTMINTSQNPLTLTIPLQRNGSKVLFKDKKISYEVDWQTHHWRSIVTAYKPSPYFEYYEDKLLHFYQKRYVFLLDFNWEILQFCMKTLQLPIDFELTETYLDASQYENDYRKLTPQQTLSVLDKVALKPYTQVFGDAFVPNLSVLDLICNEGNRGKHYL